MRIVVQGGGVVGTVTYQLLAECGRSHHVLIHDPPRGEHVDPAQGADVVVVATPCLDGTVDDPDFIAECAPRDVVVRSTITPSGYEQLRSQMLAQGCEVHHWPEFLTMATATGDSRDPDKVVFGTRLARPDALVFLDAFWGRRLTAWRDRLHLVDPQASTLAKLAINSLYTLNCAFNNALYDAADGQDDIYRQAIGVMAADRRLTVTHEDIFHGGYRGASGPCLPKDTANFADHCCDRDAAAWLSAMLVYNARLTASSAPVDA